MKDREFKELPEEFKTVLEDGTGPMKFVIQESMADETFELTPLYLSTGQEIASLCWVGKSIQAPGTIYQPCILTKEEGAKYLSYDGRVNYSGDSDLITMPSIGSLYPISQMNEYYFNDDNPLLPQKRYGLTSNNKSIRMNNISIFKEDYSKGVMMDLRASMEGVFSTEGKSGWVVILAAVDTIN